MVSLRQGCVTLAERRTYRGAIQARRGGWLMRAKKRPEIAADVTDIGARINRWRATRTKRSPMPAPLWNAAVRLAETHGIYPIARRLPVNYESLKGRVAAATRAGGGRGAGGAGGA